MWPPVDNCMVMVLWYGTHAHTGRELATRSAVATWYLTKLICLLSQRY